MRRREFITLIGGAAAWPLAAQGQQGERIRRIGVLLNLSEGDALSSSLLAAFRQGLQEAGWTEGRNAHIDVRWGSGDRDRYRKYATDLVSLAPDVVFAATTDVVTSL